MSYFGRSLGEKCSLGIKIQVTGWKLHLTVIELHIFSRFDVPSCDDHIRNLIAKFCVVQFPTYLVGGGGGVLLYFRLFKNMYCSKFSVISGLPQSTSNFKKKSTIHIMLKQIKTFLLK